MQREAAAKEKEVAKKAAWKKKLLTLKEDIDDAIGSGDMDLVKAMHAKAMQVTAGRSGPAFPNSLPAGLIVLLAAQAQAVGGGLKNELGLLQRVNALEEYMDFLEEGQVRQRTVRPAPQTGRRLLCA